ncbi:hypothetical protein BU15DRAFT_81517 [Melanogaster broomeanus]|nr:hypothetical protein BU15DRAFT_81517 [Melanogaster broomeanus]
MSSSPLPTPSDFSLPPNSSSITGASHVTVLLVLYTPTAKPASYYSKEGPIAGCLDRAGGDREEEPAPAPAAPLPTQQ